MKARTYLNLKHCLFFISIITIMPHHSYAASFVISSGTIENNVQLLRENEIGLVEEQAILDVDMASALRIDGMNASLTNNGDITSEVGVFNTSAVNITNNGRIANIATTDESFDRSITALFLNTGSFNIEILNNGEIAASSSIRPRGIFFSARNSQLVNNGIITSDNGSIPVAIDVRGENNTIINHGVIATSGSFSRGINLFGSFAGSNFKLDNFGEISAVGDDTAYALDILRGGTINNHGAIIAQGGGDSLSTPTLFAIVQEDTPDDGSTETLELNIFSGSRILGQIDLRSGFNIVNIREQDISTTLTINDLGVLTIANTVNSIRSGNVISTFDGTAQSISGAILEANTAAIHHQIHQHLAYNDSPRSVQVASTSLEAIDVSHRPLAWGQVFGFDTDRDRDGLTDAYDHDVRGFIGGYETSISLIRAGLLFGYYHSDIDTGASSIELDAESFFVGAYGQYSKNGWYLNAALIAGYEDADSERVVVDNLNGFEKARADVDTMYISPSISIGKNYALSDSLHLQPSATLSYSAARIDSYRESGTTLSNAHVDDRDVQATSARLQLVLSKKLNKNNVVGIRVGALARSTDSDDAVIQLLGSNLSFDSTADEHVSGGFVGANIRYNLADNMRVSGDIEFSEREGDERSLYGRLGLSWTF